MSNPFVILIVDDTPNNLFTLRELLKRLRDCEIIEANSGAEALTRVLERQVDLILLDVQMPGMDGFETARHLQMTERTRNIPIIFITAVFKAEEFIQRGFGVGAVDYLTKPIDDNLLINRIHLYQSIRRRELQLTAMVEQLRQQEQALVLAKESVEQEVVTRTAELAQEKQRLANILWGTDIGTWEWNVQTGETRFNERWAEMLGYRLEELSPVNIDTWKRLAHPDDQAQSGDQLARHFSGEIDHYETEARMRHKDGHWVWVLDRGKLVSRTPDGQPEWMAGTHEEITRRKQDEEFLLQLTERLSLATQAGYVGIWDYDVVNNVMTWDEQMYALYGITRDQFGGAYEAWKAGLHPDDVVRGDAEIEMALRGEKEFDTEFRVLWPNGTVRSIKALAKVIRDTAGQPVRMVGTNWDITERKNHEESILRSNAELEQFSYAVSHDMRQPLRMISSYLQLLEKSLDGQLDEEKREYFDFAIEGAQRIDQMLIALLEYSRVGRMGEPPTLIESRAVLDEALLFLQPAIAEAQARLTINGDWPCVFASHDEILRLLQNLIGNAAKYRIAGRIPEITVSSEIVRNEWHLCVADNGVGILPNQIERLFKVFQRLHNRTVYEGTGIGLALCRKIVEHHNGRIWVKSAGGGLGSKFCVALPVPRENTKYEKEIAA
jgi:PAS domain S-box-containing protein